MQGEDVGVRGVHSILLHIKASIWLKTGVVQTLYKRHFRKEMCLVKNQP
jgi:hypothetical protein